jgi:hypothetical protein
MQKNLKLGRMSYSRLEMFSQCPYKYKLQYIDGNYSNESTLVLELGSILHKGLELKYKSIIDSIYIEYNYIKNIIMNGTQEQTEKDKGQYIKGINQLKQQYGESEFIKVNEKSGVNYNEKLDIYLDRLKEDANNDEWQPIAVELPFEFIFQDRILFTGFIDRVDRNKKGQLRVVDYKSSNEVYKEDKLRTPLQMVIYALACEKVYGQIPIEFMYDFIVLGETQLAGTKGFIDRGIKKINKLLDEIEWCNSINEWIPKSTPLCFWCNFAGHTPNAPWYLAGMCQYHCLWTPENKTFEKNMIYLQQ